MKKKLIIFGNKEQAEVAFYYFDNHSNYEIIGFTVDEKFIDSTKFNGKDVIPFEEVDKYDKKEFDIFVAIGYSAMNKNRADVFNRLDAKGYSFASYISEYATIFKNVKIGRNCFILEQNNIQPFVTIGDNTVLWSGNHIGHHSKIGDHVFLTSHIVVSGGVKIEPFSFIGVNATLRDHITIGEATLIGGGAIIMRDTKPLSVFIPKRDEPINQLSSDLKI